ncbi:MAG TPA: anaerobic ribonucleoside-triphosphate reductase activating protein [Candidatus Omnitrophota bacterium]|nr:anaerobic ribonucleoside-triphosphate reductase activating protein [Candidatus Omnitrophota bacterium]
MQIGGFQKFSLIEYPGKIAAVIFTRGCNFRCPYCYNSELISFAPSKNDVDESEVLDFLQRRKGFLEGVVISGGEPTLQNDLISFLDRLKRMGYLTKLDTNGSRPDVLSKLIQLKLINFIAMDVKAPLHRYHEVIGISFPVDKIEESIEIILQSGLKYEFRTTVVKTLLSEEDIKEIHGLLDGATAYRLQAFLPSSKVLDKTFLDKEQYTNREMNDLKARFEKQENVHLFN